MVSSIGAGSFRSGRGECRRFVDRKILDETPPLQELGQEVHWSRGREEKRERCAQL